jgi:hypothetical protein
VYVTSLRGSVQWARFGNAFDNWEAENVVDLDRLGGTLLAGAGGNGAVFSRPPGAADWTGHQPSAPLTAGVEFTSVAAAGGYAFAGSSAGFFRSPGAAGGAWEPLGLDFTYVVYTRLAVDQGRVFAFVSRAIGGSPLFGSADLGSTWAPLDTLTAFVYDMVAGAGALWTARTDGLWRMRQSPLGVPRGPRAAALWLAPPTPNPARGSSVTVRFTLPRAAKARLEVLEVTGRRVATPLAGLRAVGEHSLSWPVDGLAPGVYLLSLEADGARVTRRIAITR